MQGQRAQSSQQKTPITGVQMDQVRHVIKDHLEKHKFFDSLKSAVAKDPKLAKIDRHQVIDKLKQEGILSDIISDLPVNKRGGGNISGSGSLSVSDSAPKMHIAPSRRKAMQGADLDPSKRYLSCTITTGNAFVDFVTCPPDEHMSIAISFLKNRFHTKIVPCRPDPLFDETFIFEIVGDNEKIKFDPAQLMKLNVPLHLSVLKHRKNERPVVLGTKNIEWRQILYHNGVEINAEISPVSLTTQGTLGRVTLCLDLVPLLQRQEMMLEDTVTKQLDYEIKFEKETVSRFLEYANDWWNDFKSIRSAHKSRLVKIFAETDDKDAAVYKPVCSLVSPMIADRLLESPLHAARFVSLLPFERLEAPGQDKVEVWHSMQSFLARGCGDSEDHAVLLCNLLLGFSMEAYVVVGINSEGAHAWVLTRGPANGQGKQKVSFWESLTGQRFEQDDPRVHRFYRTVGCVFNNQRFFANIQSDDRVTNTIWDFEDEYMWKAMNPGHLKALTPNPAIGYLMPSAPVNLSDEEKQLENILKDKIGSHRHTKGLQSTWDAQLSYLLSTALANYEFERIGGGQFATGEFQEGIKHYVPEGHTFKAFPIQFTHCDSERMLHHMVGNKAGEEIFLATGDQCRLAIRVRIVQYPENIQAVWVMLAARFRQHV